MARIDDLRAELAELEAESAAEVEEVIEEAVEEVEEAAEEAAEEIAEQIEAETGETVTPDERQELAGIVADIVVERLSPHLNPLPAVTPEETAEVVVEPEPEALGPDVPPVRTHFTERRIW